MGHQHSTRLADFLNVLVVLFVLLIMLAPAPVSNAASTEGASSAVTQNQSAPLSFSSPSTDESDIPDSNDPVIDSPTSDPEPTPTPLPPEKRPAPRPKVSTPSDCDPTGVITDTNTTELDLDASQGGELVARGGKLKLKAPRQAFGRNIKIRETSGGLNPGYQPVTNIFTLDAFESDCKVIPLRPCGFAARPARAPLAGRSATSGCSSALRMCVGTRSNIPT